MKEIVFSTCSTRSENVESVAKPVLVYRDGNPYFLLSYDSLNQIARMQSLNESLEVNLVSMSQGETVEVVIDANLIQAV